MSACQTTSKHQQIIGHIIAHHHSYLLVSAHIGLAEGYTYYRMVKCVVMGLEVNQLSPQSFKMAIEAQAFTLDDHHGWYVYNFFPAHQESVLMVLGGTEMS